MARRNSRRKRKRKRRAAAPAPAEAQAPTQAPEADNPMASRYARMRSKDDAARAKLKPLRPGERPTAVTVGAIVALIAALANAAAVIANLGSGDSRKLAGTGFPALLLLLIAWGMWRAKYWAVLGMQTLLALTMVGAVLSGIQAQNLRAGLVVAGLLLVCAPLFWFLIKALARIQMPTPPSARR